MKIDLLNTKTLLKTLLLNTREDQNFGSQKLGEKHLSNGVFITHYKICPLAGRKVKIDLPVDRPVDRPTVKSDR